MSVNQFVDKKALFWQSLNDNLRARTSQMDESKDDIFFMINYN